jgi:N-acyl homoserine lactone hydrolase
VGAGVELDVIVTGRAPMPPGYAHRGSGPLRAAGVLRDALLPGGEMLPSPCLAYVVRHPSEGTLLIDTGLHPDASANLRKDFGLAMSILFRTLRPADEPYEDRLRGLGVEPGEVDRVVMTHLHVDHTSGMRLLPNASFVISRREWEAAHKPRAAGKGYIAHHLPPESRVELVDIDRDGESYGPFSRTIDLLGDGTMRLISTPGHTIGHMSVLLRVVGGEVLVVGDAAYTLRNIDEQVLPLITTDDRLAAESLRELKAFKEENPAVPLVPTHDPAAWRSLAEVEAEVEV